MDQGIVEPKPKGAQDEASSLDLRVSGMNCAARVRRVERALLGGLSAEVNLASERASLRVAAGPAGAGAGCGGDHADVR
jgi:hypothetical protein